MAAWRQRGREKRSKLDSQNAQISKNMAFQAAANSGNWIKSMPLSEI